MVGSGRCGFWRAHLAGHDGRVEQSTLGRSLVWPGAPWPTHRADAGDDAAHPSRWWRGFTTIGSNGLPGHAGTLGTAPVGLVAGLPLATVAHRARQAAAVIQPDPQALDVAAAEAVAVAVAARDALEPDQADAAVELIAAQVRFPELRAALGRVPAMSRRATTPQQVTTHLSPYRPAVDAVATSLTAVLLHPDDPMAAVRFAGRAGGGAHAAVAAGVLCGARHGEEALPKALSVPFPLLRVADALARLPAA